MSIQRLPNASAFVPDKLIIDTNVWLYTAFKLAHARYLAQAKQYQSFILELIAHRQTTVLIPNSVCREITSVWIRHEIDPDSILRGKAYKAARQQYTFPLLGDRFQQLADVGCRFLPEPFDYDILTRILDTLPQADYTDALLVQLARQEQAALLTHDADFGAFADQVDIYTLNPKLR